MKVGLFLICHPGIAEVLLNTAVQILGDPPLEVTILSIPNDSNVDAMQAEAKNIVACMGKDHDVLILTDLYGSTPNNIASTLYQQGHISIVSGLNVAMLLKVFTYSSLSLGELLPIVYNGAKQSIVVAQSD